jgi:hypothetical protein
MNQSNDELDLLRRLRQLPREVEPAHDLWAGIAARIEAPPAASLPRARRWRVALALAASSALVFVLAWQLMLPVSDGPTTAPLAGATPARDELVRRQAEAIAIEYRLALEPFAAAPMPSALLPAATELDSSAEQLLDALREQPDATYLLDRLRRTYDQRLKLAQRVALG